MRTLKQLQVPVTAPHTCGPQQPAVWLISPSRDTHDHQKRGSEIQCVLLFWLCRHHLRTKISAHLYTGVGMLTRESAPLVFGEGKDGEKEVKY
jgi:hypothetical protein